MTAALAFAPDPWRPILDGLHADALDCLQANLAAYADLHHGSGRHVGLGARLRLPDPIAAPELEERLTEASELLGLRVAARWDGLDGPRLRALAREHGTLYVVSDAYTLSWVPYAGHRHMGHSFLLTETGATYEVVDAYRNVTEWGEARPGRWSLRAEELDACLTSATALALVAGGVPELDPAAALLANATALRRTDAPIATYVAGLRRQSGAAEVVERVSLDIWSLARSRDLHARWLAGHSPVADLAAEHASQWLALAMQSYVAQRRARRGGELPDALVDELERLLCADVHVARQLAARTVVIDELAATLDCPPAAVAAGGPLRALPRFDSFRLVAAIEACESRLRLTLDANRLTAAALRTVDSLCELFARALSESETA